MGASMLIAGGEVLGPDGVDLADLRLAEGRIAAVADALPPLPDEKVLDASGLLVLPGIVDIHGDAFERQIMPRPEVHFPLDVALLDTDRQLAANGITTAFHGLTLSWEPGLRSLENGAAVVAALEATREQLTVDHRLHIRWETFALDAEAQVHSWLTAKVPPLFAFNDHTTGSVRKRTDPVKMRSWAQRCGLSEADYRGLLDAVWARRTEVEPAIERIAAAARRRGVTMLSHDDTSPEVRARYRALGCSVAEFPLTWETAAAARAAGEHVVLGAPNVVRGGSHIGAVNAAEAAEAGRCTVLASDYYYPAPLSAAFRLAADGRLDLAQAWPLVSRNPAQAAGLDDRGELSEGRRADVVLVRAGAGAPRVVATISDGRLVHLGEPGLL